MDHRQLSAPRAIPPVGGSGARCWESFFFYQSRPSSPVLVLLMRNGL